MKRLRDHRRCLAVVWLASLLLGAASSTAQPGEPSFREIPLSIDSGAIDSDGDRAAVVWSAVVEIPDATWIQLRFGPATQLDAADDSSVVRISSFDDFATQNLDQSSLVSWRGSSAYFNGGRLVIELIAAPGTKGNRIDLTGARAGVMDDALGPASICGPTDDRLLLDDPRVGRSWPSACTAFMIDDRHRQFLTAGHCAEIFQTVGEVIEFNVPFSNIEGTPRHPPPEDQYPVDPESIQFASNGEGDDWAYFGCGLNSETGLTAFLVQGDFLSLGDMAPPDTGQSIRVTGYGSVRNPISPQWNLVQKTHVGPYRGVVGTVVRYTVDTTSGNSGSPVFDQEAMEVIGIHTHGGCDISGGSNIGTAINHPDLLFALSSPRGVCGPFDLTVSQLIAGELATATASGVAPGATVYFGYSLTGLGETIIEPLGVVMRLDAPRLIDSAVADADGVAEIQGMTPQSLQNRLIVLQAATVGQTSTVRRQRVN
ncbi:MAG: trypsin-like serine peptidase [Phycisphaerales bacterium]